MTMNHLLLRPVGALAKITDEQVDQLRIVSGVHISRVSPNIVSVHFGGDEENLKARLAGTAWSSFHISTSRTYRL
jgi:hypothetical protein